MSSILNCDLLPDSGGITRAVAVWALVLGCGCPPSSLVGSTLGEATVLRVGQVAKIRGEGLRIGFTGVRDDSRCPPPETGVVCVWQGVATALVWAEQAPQPRSEIALATTDTATQSRVAQYLRYEIELVDLAPPHIGEIRQSDYRVTLVVRRAE